MLTDRQVRPCGVSIRGTRCCDTNERIEREHKEIEKHQIRITKQDAAIRTRIEWQSNENRQAIEREIERQSNENRQAIEREIERQSNENRQAIERELKCN